MCRAAPRPLPHPLRARARRGKRSFPGSDLLLCAPGARPAPPCPPPLLERMAAGWGGERWLPCFTLLPAPSPGKVCHRSRWLRHFSAPEEVVGDRLLKNNREGPPAPSFPEQIKGTERLGGRGGLLALPLPHSPSSRGVAICNVIWG